ncbi:unnamed protein product [Sphagnum jensenii]
MQGAGGGSSSTMAGYPNAGQSNMAGGQPQQSPAQSPMDQILGNPQTQSFAKGGRPRKRSSMIEVYMAPDEIKAMVEAQGGPDHDRLTGRHMFKKLSRFIENPHLDRAIRDKFAMGGSIGSPVGAPVQAPPMNGVESIINRAHELGMSRPGFAHGGAVSQYNMPARSPLSDEKYARGGDTELVYITPHMKRLFDDLGKGSINPITGHPEYFGLSDIWNGVKSFGSAALGGLNSVAPKLAEMARPYAAKLPGMAGQVANAALDYAPGLINSLNSYVNPSAPPTGQSPQDQQQNQAGFEQLPFNGEASPQQQNPSFGQHMGNYAAQTAGQIAGRIGGPAGQAAQAGINSYMGGRDMRRIGSNMFGAGTAPMRNMPGMDIARTGVQAYGRGASPMDTMRQMGGQAMNQFMGGPRGNNGSNNDRRAMESQYLDQIYKQPQYQNSYA